MAPFSTFPSPSRMRGRSKNTRRLRNASETLAGGREGPPAAGEARAPGKRRETVAARGPHMRTHSTALQERRPGRSGGLGAQRPSSSLSPLGKCQDPPPLPLFPPSQGLPPALALTPVTCSSLRGTGQPLRGGGERASGPLGPGPACRPSASGLGLQVSLLPATSTSNPSFQGENWMPASAWQALEPRGWAWGLTPGFRGGERGQAASLSPPTTPNPASL